MMHFRAKQAAIAAAAAIFLSAGPTDAQTNSGANSSANPGAKSSPNPGANPSDNSALHFPGKYPGPRCGTPEFEVLPQAEDPNTTDQAKTSLKDYEVRQYNREVEAYGACMKAYIAKAKGDAARIQAEADAETKRINDSAHASIGMIQAEIDKATANAKKLTNTPASALVGK